MTPNSPTEASLRAAVALAIVAASALAACSTRPPAVVGGTAESQASAPAPAPAAPSAGQTISATVLETMDASTYTYVRVKADSGELWAAASKFDVAVGDKVVLSLDQPMVNFHSQSLNRDFPLIYFVARIDRGGAAVPPAIAVGHGGQGAAGSAPAERLTTPVEPAPDGTTVAALWKTRSGLAGKTVKVRGKVMKFNGGILGVNWIHLQDGTGQAADGSNDITVTSDMTATVGDIVTVTGTVTLNKDLGSGYSYPVIIERARVAR
jgi:hypothetical protein